MFSKRTSISNSKSKRSSLKIFRALTAFEDVNLALNFPDFGSSSSTTNVPDFH